MRNKFPLLFAKKKVFVGKCMFSRMWDKVAENIFEQIEDLRLNDNSLQIVEFSSRELLNHGNSQIYVHIYFTANNEDTIININKIFLDHVYPAGNTCTICGSEEDVRSSTDIPERYDSPICRKCIINNALIKDVV